jgi:hypothetical protein
MAGLEKSSAFLSALVLELSISFSQWLVGILSIVLGEEH